MYIQNFHLLVFKQDLKSTKQVVGLTTLYNFEVNPRKKVKSLKFFDSDSRLRLFCSFFSIPTKLEKLRLFSSPTVNFNFPSLMEKLGKELLSGHRFLATTRLVDQQIIQTLSMLPLTPSYRHTLTHLSFPMPAAPYLIPIPSILPLHLLPLSNYILTRTNSPLPRFPSIK